MKDTNKTAILLVAFGSTAPGAQKGFSNIYNKIKQAFPSFPISWAYTSGFIRKKLKKQGTEIDSPLIAISKLIEDGYTNIIVQSTHIVPGAEFSRLQETTNALQKAANENIRITLGNPLLYTHEDMLACIKAFRNNLPQIKDDEAILLMGHGTEHASNVYYPAFSYYLKEHLPNVVLATIEGYPTLTDAIRLLKSERKRKVLLMPFLTVLGDHVKKDMCGEDDRSWLNQLLENNFETEVILSALTEIDDFIAIWISHLKQAINIKH